MREELTEIVKSKDLKDISVDVIENILDNEITNEALKEVPIVKSLIAVRNIFSSISDRIFLKKALIVLLELKDLSETEREIFVEELSDKFSTGAEKILLAIEKLDSYEKCKVFGRLSFLRAQNQIDIEDYLRLTKIIKDAYLPDLELILDINKGRNDLLEEVYHPLVSLGLIFEERSEQTPIKKNEFAAYEGREEYEGGEINFYYHLTFPGSVLLEHYKFLFSD